MRASLTAVSASALALVVVAAGLASNPAKEKIARTAAGDAEAKAHVLRKADLPSGWTGGSAKPDLSSSLGCSSYKPKQNDLVLIGAAETRWKMLPSTVDSQTEVLRNARMVKLDWRRTVTDRRVLPCLRQASAKQPRKTRSSSR